mmetsp:Transcript_13605/g.30005  ORF Transcript_13605/g.30005 Transcript_13605/m.30005 type:complete len:201 (-) Transcript_13605:731-1333(-)
MISTGMALTYSSATTSSPLRSSRCFTVPSSLVTISFTGDDSLTDPPWSSMCCVRGAHRRAGWLPSKKAHSDPCCSFINLFMAVRITAIDSLSGSMKSSALAMGWNISWFMRSGMPYFSMYSITLSSSCSSINACPCSIMGTRAGTVRSFSERVSIFRLVRIASAKCRGAGTPGMKLKVVNSPGNSCIAKTIWCSFHCSLS